MDVRRDQAEIKGKAGTTGFAGVVRQVAPVGPQAAVLPRTPSEDVGPGGFAAEAGRSFGPPAPRLRHHAVELGRI
jgi:hypothetical protein